MDTDYVNYNGPGNRPFSYATYKPNNEIVQEANLQGLIILKARFRISQQN